MTLPNRMAVCSGSQTAVILKIIRFASTILEKRTPSLGLSLESASAKGSGKCYKLCTRNGELV